LPLYPASAQKCCGCSADSSGRGVTIASSVGSKSFTSCTLAPLTASNSGTPRPSTNKLRLRPFFPPIRGVRSHALLPPRRFSHRPIGALPLPGYALHAVIFGQAGLPQSKKESGLLPVLKILMHRAGRAKLARQGFPLNTRAQHINNRGEHLPCRHGLAPRSRLTLILPARFSFLMGNQRLHLGPQLVRYLPRLDLRHPERYLRPACPGGCALSVFTYQV